LRPAGQNATRYLMFMSITAAQCRIFAHRSDAPNDMVKALDEWNYVTITHRDAVVTRGSGLGR
jgi:hypothetical protein